MNEREIFMVTEKRNRYSTIIKEQHRLPKAERNHRLISQAKIRMEVLSKWLKNN